jgi:hypothetical protein
MEAAAERGGEPSELKPLIYPVVQVTIGAIKYVSDFLYSYRGETNHSPD